jgi:hypothetical protein
VSLWLVWVNGQSACALNTRYLSILLRCVDLTSRISAPSKCNVVYWSVIGHYFATCFGLNVHLQSSTLLLTVMCGFFDLVICNKTKESQSQFSSLSSLDSSLIQVSSNLRTNYLICILIPSFRLCPWVSEAHLLAFCVFLRDYYFFPWRWRLYNPRRRQLTLLVLSGVSLQ